MLRRVWYAIKPNTIRRAVAVIMVIIGLGRLGVYASRTPSLRLPDDLMGAALVIVGLALYIGRARQHTWPGRLVAAAGTLLLMTLAWDAAMVSIGVTSLLELWLSLLLLYAVFTNDACA